MSKKLFWIVGVLVVVAGAVSAQTTESELRNRYVEYLRQEGYNPSVDGDGDVLFKVAGDSYYILVNADDLEYFQIYQQLGLGTYALAEVRNAVNYANRTTKVAKVYITSNEKSVVIKVDQMLGKPDDFKAIFDRLLSIMDTAEENLRSQL